MLWIRAGGGRLDVDFAADADLQLSSNSLKVICTVLCSPRPSAAVRIHARCGRLRGVDVDLMYGGGPTSLAQVSN
ncbi:hypothetical protein B0H14DRAFT_3174058 [Mycena olivaceomarginata]|nr:hypothetical protein B0H14DRAFT_3174058 [Mycena olivaceomarginata]